MLSAIVLIHSPSDVETAIYPYLLSLYALLISTLLSLLQSNLTQNDGVFVLVAIASPVTLYLWSIFLFAFLFRRAPSWISSNLNRTHQFFLTISTIGSFAFWLALVALVVGEPRSITFSQPACNEKFGLVRSINIAWPVPYFIQATILCIALNLVTLIPRSSDVS